MQRNGDESDVTAIVLRTVRREDFPALFEIQADPESNAMAGTKPRTRDAFVAAWERNLADPGINARVIEVGRRDGGGREIAGSISCFAAEGHECVGYWIARAHWGRGVASRALELFLREEARRPLHATTASTNGPSQRILTKCGFRRVGQRMGEETERYLGIEIVDFVLE